ncbi:MAG: hypothetical protein ACTSXU_10400 [Promethearchaeota archaeon]
MKKSNITNIIGQEKSDTVITKNWEAIETLSEWWDNNWLYRKKIIFTEPGLMDRDRDPLNIFITFSGFEAHENSLRLTFFRNDSTWVEVDSQVWNATIVSNGTDNFYSSCTLMFFLNIIKGDTEIYYLYYDPSISTPAAYTDHITVKAVNSPDITDDTNMPSVQYANGTTQLNVDAFDIIVDNDYSTPQSEVALVDTERGASDWGGPSCSIIRAEYNDADTLNINGLQWMSVGEMALDAIGYDSVNNVPNGFSGSYRANVGPDNPAEAWDGNGKVEVVEDGPLFTKIKIQTTDGAYQLSSGTNWWQDNLGGAISADSVTRDNGAAGYIKYNITYTFYYYGPSTFVAIDLDFGAFPQRGAVGSGYPIENAGYQDTFVYFKNYGDWPHLMQLVSASNSTPTLQNMKSWYGTKYGYFQEYIDNKRRDYPLEPWTAWWDNASGSDPSIGMMAITDGVGWEVLSLAVPGIGNNSLLQQILPEGHQGDQFLISNGTIMRYNYFLMTTAHGTNDTQIRDMARRVNKPVNVSISDTELFEHNSLFIHVNDIDGNTALETYVRVFNSLSVKINDSIVSSSGNVTFQRLPDGTYTVEVYFFTDNLGREYVANRETIVMNHLIQRSYFRNYNSNLANLSLNVVNWARNNELLTGAQVRIKNSSTGGIIEQNITWNGAINFRLYASLSTTYNVEIWYGGTNRTMNVSTTQALSSNRVINIGVQVETTAITMVFQNDSIGFGENFTMRFYFHKSSDINEKYMVQNISISSEFDSDYWAKAGNFDWSFNPSTNITEINITSGFSSRLNDSGVFEVYIHVENESVESSVEKIFIVVGNRPTGIQVVVNNTDITSQAYAEFQFTSSINITVYYYTTIPSLVNITNDANVTMVNETGHTWTLSPVGSGYVIIIDSTALSPSSKYSFTITCTNQSTETQIFKFNLFPRDVSTDLIVEDSSFHLISDGDMISVNWSDQVEFYCKYNDTLNNVLITNPSTSVIALVGNATLNATLVSNVTGYWRFLLNTSHLPVLVGGTTLVTFRASLVNYQLSEFTFNLYTRPIEMKLTYTVNNQSLQELDDVYLSQNLTFSMSVSTWNDLPILDASVVLSYENNTGSKEEIRRTAMHQSGGNYSLSIPLDLNTFYGGRNQFFYLYVEKDNYTAIIKDIVVKVNPIQVDTIHLSGVNESSDTVVVSVGQSFDLAISFKNNITGNVFSENVDDFIIEMSSAAYGIHQLEYDNETGKFHIILKAPYQNGTIPITIYITAPPELERQYQFDEKIVIYVQVEKAGGGVDPIVFWIVFSALIVVSVYFVLYQVRFKYPPMIRKIHDLKRAVVRGKKPEKIRLQNIQNREENIFWEFAKTLNKYSFLQTRDSKYAAKSRGYAPLPDESIELDFEMPALEHPSPVGEMKPATQVELKKPLSKEPPRKLPKPGEALPVSKAPAKVKGKLPAKTAAVSPSKEPVVKKVVRPISSKAAQPKSTLAKPPVTPRAAPSTRMPRVKTPPPSPKPTPRHISSKGTLSTENLYQQLVMLEQKRYKAERSLRELNAKHNRGQLTEKDFNEYEAKIKASLDKIKSQITELRRRMLAL